MPDLVLTVFTQAILVCIQVVKFVARILTSSNVIANEITKISISNYFDHLQGLDILQFGEKISTICPELHSQLQLIVSWIHMEVKMGFA